LEYRTDFTFIGARCKMTAGKIPLLSVSISVRYPGHAPVLRQLVLDINEREILGLAGSSGSGKSTLALAIMRLLPRRCELSGRIDFDGIDLMSINESKLRSIRGREIALILQSSTAALNPMLRVGTQLKEAWRAHNLNGEGTEHIRQTLRSVSLPDDAAFLRRYPSQISVGQGQRLLIAMAVLHRPTLIIADEPTSALDAITQREILDLLRQCNERYGTAILVISHDLRVLESICQRVAILDAGQIIDCKRPDLLGTSEHTFTKSLVHAAGRV
jgi:ABC-type dipeptide/oligopeptide/nickel transport system ATPase component